MKTVKAAPTRRSASDSPPVPGSAAGACEATAKSKFALKKCRPWTPASLKKLAGSLSEENTAAFERAVREGDRAAYG